MYTGTMMSTSTLSLRPFVCWDTTVCDVDLVDYLNSLLQCQTVFQLSKSFLCILVCQTHSQPWCLDLYKKYLKLVQTGVSLLVYVKISQIQKNNNNSNLLFQSISFKTLCKQKCLKLVDTSVFFTHEIRNCLKWRKTSEFFLVYARMA